MSFQIERGLFGLDFIDHHAILGVPVDAEVKDIRKRYLKIARRLHPDSCVNESDDYRQLASQFLSKLVNPAWEKLSQESARSEYQLLLKLKGQAAMRKPNDMEVLSSLASQLSTAPNPDPVYRSAMADLAERQYDKLDQTLELIAQISELNLVYLMRTEGKSAPAANEAPKFATAPSAEKSSAAASPPPPPKAKESIVDQSYRRAEAFLSKGNFAQATLELREALQREPNNSRCHSLMGVVYLRQNQATMAKIHFNKALSLDPQDPIALKGKQALEKLAQRQAAQAAPAKTPPAKSNQGKSSGEGKSGGGLFGGMFGGKK